MGPAAFYRRFLSDPPYIVGRPISPHGRADGAAGLLMRVCGAAEETTPQRLPQRLSAATTKAGVR